MIPLAILMLLASSDVARFTLYGITFEGQTLVVPGMTKHACEEVLAKLPTARLPQGWPEGMPYSGTKGAFINAECIDEIGTTP